MRLPFRNPSEPTKPEFDVLEYLKELISLGMIVFLIVVPMMFTIWAIIELIDHDPFGRSIFERAKYSFITPKIFFLNIPCIIAIVSCIIFTIIQIKKFNKRKSEYKTQLKKNEATCQNNETNYTINCSNAEKKSAELVTINNELQRAKDILTEAYSINWIPSKYRDIRVVYYIADMVTTSDINMDEALKYYLLQEANNKLDEILQKLDEIIANQNEIICQQAIAQSQNEALISQNKKMISQFANIETNTKLAADYSAIGANYSAATAYFSLATYLKN